MAEERRIAKADSRLMIVLDLVAQAAAFSAALVCPLGRLKVGELTGQLTRLGLPER